MKNHLNQTQIEQYHRDGFLVLEEFLSPTWLKRLRQTTEAFVEESRKVEHSDKVFDVEPDHTNDNPRLRRLNNPSDQDETYWEFSSQSEIVDLAEDILGPDIKFHHSKLNFKFPHGGEEVKWHQDIQFWPHTNYDLITIGVYLEDVVKGQGEMGFIPRSHSGPLFDQYEKDIWRGYIQSADLPDIQAEPAIFPTGKAGTVTIHNCRTIHGSYPNHSSHRRPLLLQTYSAADAFAYTDLVRKTKHGEHIIRGKVSRWARHDPRPCLVPPTKVGTIFQAQQKEI